MRKCGLLLWLSSFSLAPVSAQNARFVLPQLRYAYNALEPYIDATTMEIHYTKHHQGYVDKLNKAVEEAGIPQSISLEEILKNISKYNTTIRNNAGGHYNHTLYWDIMGPAPEGPMGGKPSGKLAEAIHSTFGSFEKFKEEFKKAALGVFGSGWAWLIVQNGKLKITTTPNQDNPLMDIVQERGIPILGLDVWEHAYYLKYQYKRGDYIDAWWNVVNWNIVNKKYIEALEKEKAPK